MMGGSIMKDGTCFTSHTVNGRQQCTIVLLVDGSLRILLVFLKVFQRRDMVVGLNSLTTSVLALHSTGGNLIFLCNFFHTLRWRDAVQVSSSVVQVCVCQ